MYDVYLTNKGARFFNELKRGDKLRVYDGEKYYWDKITYLDTTPLSVSVNNPKVFKCDNGYSVTTSKLLDEYDMLSNSYNLYLGSLVKEYLEPRQDNHNYNPFYVLVGCFLADGQLPRCEQYIDFHIDNDTKTNVLSKLCDDLGYKIKLINDKYDNLHAIINNNNFTRYCRHLYNKKHDNYQFPFNIWDNKSALYNVIKGILFNASKDDLNYTYDTENYLFAVELNYALSLIGIKHTIEYNKEEYNIKLGEYYNSTIKTKIASIDDTDKDYVEVVETESGHVYVKGLGGLLCL